MSAFFLAASLFVFAFAVHVAIWRLRPPRATGHTLILVLVICILGGAAALALGDQFFPSWRAWLPPTLSDWLQAVVAALAVACLYVMNYPAVEVDSPSLAMADLFARAGDNGLSREELYRTRWTMIFLSCRDSTTCCGKVWSSKHAASTGSPPGACI